VTLLLALITNAIYTVETGHPFLDTEWIVVLWLAHLVFHAERAK